MQAKTKSVILLVGIFLAGVVSGGLFGGFAAGKSYGWIVLRSKPLRPPPRPDFVNRTLDSLTKELALTDEQRTSIEKLVRETDEQLKAIRKETMQVAATRIHEMHERVSLLLTDPQKVMLADFQKREEAARNNQGSPAPTSTTPRPSPDAGRTASPNP